MDDTFTAYTSACILYSGEIVYKQINETLK